MADSIRASRRSIRSLKLARLKSGSLRRYNRQDPAPRDAPRQCIAVTSVKSSITRCLLRYENISTVRGPLRRRSKFLVGRLAGIGDPRLQVEAAYAGSTYVTSSGMPNSSAILNREWCDLIVAKYMAISLPRVGRKHNTGPWFRFIAKSCCGAARLVFGERHWLRWG